MKYDVVIIGGGVIGSMLARELSRYRLSLCVVEKESDAAMHASGANSGIIHGGYDPIPGTLKARLNREGVPLLYHAARELSVPFCNNGSLICAFGTEEEGMIRTLYDRGVQNGIFGLRILTGDEVRSMEPAVSPLVTMALHVPTGGIISPYRLTFAALGCAMDHGADFMPDFQVTEMEKTEEAIVLHAADGRRVEAAFAVNCAGAFADRIAAMAGDDFFRILPRAGEYLLMDRETEATVKHTIFQVPGKMGKGILVTPTVDGNLLLGPTATQVNSPQEKATCAEGLEQVKKGASKSVPNLRFSNVITSFAGVRASCEEGDFIIEPSKNVKGLLHLAAIDSPGLTCCVSIARYAVEKLRQMGVHTEKKTEWTGKRKERFCFSDLKEEEKDEYVKIHPEYGKIVCRCEGISEGEIRSVIRQNPPARDVDGVKRRVRAGMGRCQGGFCTPHVMRILAEEMKIPMEQVTKKGGESKMVKGKI